MKLLFIGAEQDALQQASTIHGDGGHAAEAAENPAGGRIEWLNEDPMGSSSITIRSMVIDRTERTVTVNQKSVSLTYKEYCLLEFLAVQRGTLVSRTEIYYHLFDVIDPSVANLLDVYMCNIRRKLGENFIATRRGAGYVIEVET